MGAVGIVVIGAVGGLAALVAASEVANGLVSRRPSRLDTARTTAVIVLGYPTTRHGGLHPIQRWRSRIGVRTLSRVDIGWLIFSGGAARDATESEAAVMARYAVTHLEADRGRIELEEEARSTWDNVRLAVPMAQAHGAEQIVVASDPFHADKARRYLALQFPELAPISCAPTTIGRSNCGGSRFSARPIT